LQESDGISRLPEELMSGQCIFYFGEESEFSHWYKCKFVIDGKTFCCAGQYIMYKKALLFNDDVVAAKILNSSDAKRHHYLGKQVKHFDKAIWQKHCMQYSFEANLAKFGQNPGLRKLLLKTSESRFAEASPYDRIWGIGLSKSNPKIYDRKNWRGKTLPANLWKPSECILKKTSA
jgi:ribA/ribD-fused uncharacterized protein